MFENHLVLDANGFIVRNYSEADDSLMPQRNPKNDTLSKHRAYTYIIIRQKLYFIKIYRSNDILPSYNCVTHLFRRFKKGTINFLVDS